MDTVAHAPVSKPSHALRKAGIIAHRTQSRPRATVETSRGQEVLSDDEIVIIGESSTSKRPAESNVSIDRLDPKDFKVFRLETRSL